MATDERLPAEHDVDRILYSSWFRRLTGVTQVVAVRETQLFHNRLTHTIKVAQLARRFAEDIERSTDKELLAGVGGVSVHSTEAAALAHDLGHPPFGHIAEAQLNTCLESRGWGGYEGNAQSFRILTKLAQRAGDGFGLGLQVETLNGVLKYPWLRGPEPAEGVEQTAEQKLHRRKWGAYESEKKDFDRVRDGRVENRRNLEAEIMDWCDDISYALHDLEDFYIAGLIPVERLRHADAERVDFLMKATADLSKKPEFNQAASSVAFTKIQGLIPQEAYKGTQEDRRMVHIMTNNLINAYCGAITINEHHPHFRVSAQARSEVDLLKQLTWQYVVNSPALATVQQGQIRIIDCLFKDLLKWLKDEIKEKSSHRLPARLQRLYMSALADPDLNVTGSATGEDPLLGRVIADYIASLTEDQAIDMHARLRGLDSRSVLDGWVRW